MDIHYFFVVIFCEVAIFVIDVFHGDIGFVHDKSSVYSIKQGTGLETCASAGDYKSDPTRKKFLTN